MNARPAILFYCQHSLGMGHLVRSLALADRLSRRFRVMLLNGGRLPASIKVPSNIQLVNLPPLGIDEANQLVSHDKRISVERALDRRQKMIRVAFDNLRPVAVLVELFPFGRKKFANEILPLLRAARSKETRALVVSSLRDILVSRSRNQQEHDDRAAAWANEFFDVVLIHSDPTFARFEESFHSNVPLQVPIKYTGFVVPMSVPAPASTLDTGRKRILVSAGGGIAGEPLLRTAIEAHNYLQEDPELEMKMIAGPFLSDESWRALRSLARGRNQLRLVRQVNDLCGELSSAVVSISQAGYNTCLDVLRAKVPAILVPFGKEDEDEQRRRALRLQELGAVRVIEQKDLTGAQLAAEIRRLVNSKFTTPALDLNGAENSAALIESMTAARLLPLTNLAGHNDYAH
jgi:predicted glycosyltransferase